MTGTRVLVTGVGDRLGRLIAEQIATRDDVDVVIGVTGANTPTIAGVQVIGLPGEYDGIADLLQGRAIDTIIHAERPWARSRVDRNATAQHVIATMRLAAAAARRTTTVRRVVMTSSTRVYPVSSRAARLHPESEHLQPRRGSLAALLVEAEGYVRTLATTNPNLSASILRLADLAGPGTHDPLPSVLAGPVIPAVWGFDPSVQLLHIDDAVTALGHAADRDLAGIYNVAADDPIRWRRAARLARKPLLELPAAPAKPLAGLLGQLYRLDGDDLLERAALRPRRGDRCLHPLRLPAVTDHRTMRAGISPPESPRQIDTRRAVTPCASAGSQSTSIRVLGQPRRAFAIGSAIEPATTIEVRRHRPRLHSGRWTPRHCGDGLGRCPTCSCLPRPGRWWARSRPIRSRWWSPPARRSATPRPSTI